MKCPEVHLLRAFAEPEGVSGLVDDVDEFRRHVESCARCKKVVEDARDEERTLRTLRPEKPVGSGRALEKTLARLDRGGAGSRRRLPSGVLPIIASLATVGFLLVLVRTPDTKPQAEPPPPEAPRIEPPTTTPPAPPREAPKEPDRKPADETPEIAPVPSEERAPEPPPPDVPERPEEPAPPITHRPEQPESQARALAFARSGKLTASGRALALGEALPESVTITAGSVPSEIELVGSSSIVLAPRATFRISASSDLPEVFLATGKLLATSHGGHYSVVTRDGRATPCGTSFVVAVEANATRVATLEGEVELAPATGPIERVARVRAGFEARAAKGKTDLPRPAQEKLDWIPRDKRPRPPKTPTLVLELAFDPQTGKFPHLTQGTLEGAIARATTRPGGASLVQLTGPRLVELSPDLWFEVTLRTDRAKSVELMIWDDDIKENFAKDQAVEPGRWVTVAAPLADFFDKAKLSRKIASGHTTHEAN
ncbi:MAG TPA: FecR domain-containing protein, partial [Planctomycetota bacterium]|nr:FecR domain-containing protein [Planctomycetota bacterium]